MPELVTEHDFHGEGSIQELVLADNEAILKPSRLGSKSESTGCRRCLAQLLGSSDIREPIRQRAYELYEQRGRIDGFALDAAGMVVFGRHPERSLGMLLQAFSSRFAIGFLAANVSLRIHPAISGALVGLLISLPDAVAMKSYAGIIGTGLSFSALAGGLLKRGGLSLRSARQSSHCVL